MRSSIKLMATKNARAEKGDRALKKKRKKMNYFRLIRVALTHLVHLPPFVHHLNMQQL